MGKTCDMCGTVNAVDVERCTFCKEILSIQQNDNTQSSNNLDNQINTHRRSGIGGKNRMWSKGQKRMVGVLFVIVLLLLIIVIPIFFTKINKSKPIPIVRSTSISILNSPLPVGLGESELNGQMIGINDGSFAPFDLGHSKEELNFKKMACDALKQGQGQEALSLWRQALTIDSNDAEALMYIENERIRISGKQYITLAAGIGLKASFANSVNQSNQEMLQGIYTAQHEYNLHNNLQVRILIANSGSEESSVPLITQQIVQTEKQENIVGILGWLDSASTLQALPILSKNSIPLISPEATSDELSKISPYFFRVVPPNSSQAKAGAKFVENILHVHNIVMFSDPGDSYSQNLADDFIKQFAADNFQITSHTENFTTSKTENFSRLITDALTYHPDLLYFTSSRTSDSGAFEDLLPTKGSYAKLPVLSGDAGYAIHPNSYGRWFFTALAFPDEWTAISAPLPHFFQEYRENFDPDNTKPDAYDYGRAREEAILSYDAASVTLQALLNVEASKQNMPSPQDITNALSHIRGNNAFQGVSGQISFGDNHDPIDKAVLILSASESGYTQGSPPIGCFLKECSR